MPAERKRYTDDNKPAPCVVRIPPALAAFLYRETRGRGYNNETELVNDIIRRWSEDLEPLDWKALLKELKADDDTEERGRGRGSKVG